MRIRRRRMHRGHARKAGMKGDWLVLGHTDCLQLLGPVQQCLNDEYTAAGVHEFALIDGVDLVAKQDSLTIVRMVGELAVLFTPTLAPGGTTPIVSVLVLQQDEMIHKTSVGDGGSTALLDPRRELSGENDDILWRRRTHISSTLAVPVSGIGLASIDYDQNEFSSPHLDIRVKRRMVSGDVLLYSVAHTVVHFTSNVLNLNQALGTLNPQLSMNMRGYVKF